MEESVRLVDEVLGMEHVEWETILFVGETEFHRSKDGPFPNRQIRLSARPSLGCAAINYMDHDDRRMPMANTYAPPERRLEVDLIFNGATGAVFPRTAVISIQDARSALIEWLETWERPKCVEWRRCDD